MPQRDHRVDLRRASRGNLARHQRYGDETSTFALLAPRSESHAYADIPTHASSVDRNPIEPITQTCGFDELIRARDYFGRSAAHSSKASSAGHMAFPHSVRSYSTFGGTWG